MSPPVPALSSAIVSALIDPLTYGWNSHTIDNTFLPFEAMQIKSIPLGIIKQPDLLYWPWSRDGSYSVSTGYQRLCVEEQSDSVSPSNLDKTHGFWKKLWKAGVPGKLKHFLWKACSNALPTKVSLLQRKSLQKAPVHIAKTRPKQSFMLSGNVTQSGRFGRQISNGWITKNQPWDPFKI